MTPAAHHPVILTYHSIADGPSPLEIPPKIFVQQMEWLAANARVAPLAEIVDAIKKKTPLPERTAALTFDDGYADFAEHAAPVLQRLNLRAVVFLPTAFAGGANTWPNPYSARKPLMSWDQIKVLSAGFEFGCHSHAHLDLTEADASVACADLKQSIIELETRLGKSRRFFCYPYGRWNNNAREIVSQLFEGACTTGAGLAEPDSDPYALPRVDAHYVRDLNRFRTLFTPEFEGYLRLRRWVRRLRCQPEGKVARLR